MSTPGAKILTRGPKFDHSGFASVESMAPTVMAVGTSAGELPDASAYFRHYQMGPARNIKLGF